MTLHNEGGAFGTRKSDTVVITSASTATQLLRIPWSSPYNMKAKLRKLQITNVDVSGAQVLIWDDDLSETTPVGRGTGTLAGCLLNIGVAAAVNSGATSTTVVYDNLPAIEFEAGLAIVSNRVNTQVSVEIEAY